MKCRVCKRSLTKEEIREKAKLGIDLVDLPKMCVCKECKGSAMEWAVISRIKLPEKLIEKYKDKVYWDYISKYQKLSPKFISKYINKIQPSILINRYYENYPASIKLLIEQKFPEQARAKVKCIMCNRTVIEEYYEDNIEFLGITEKEFREIYCCGQCRIEPGYDYISWNWSISTFAPLLPPQFIEKYADKLNWGNVSHSRYLTVKFVTKFVNRVTEHILDNPIYKELPRPLQLLLTQKFDIDKF